MISRSSLALALSACIVTAQVLSPAVAAAQSTPPSPAPPSAQSSPQPMQGGGLPPPPVPVVLPPVPSIAPGFSAPVSAVPNGELIGVQQQPFVGLALQDAIAMALQRNTDLALAQSNRRIANYQIIAAEGAYDVRFQLVPQYSHSVSAAVSSFSSGPGAGPVTQDTAGVTAAFQGATQNGGTYRAGVVGTRITSNSTINSYDPFYETALQLSITQPLGRGRAIDQNRLQLQLARTNASIQNDIALTQASNTVVQVSNAYYDLVAAWRNVAIQEEGLRNAQAQAASNARLARSHRPTSSRRTRRSTSSRTTCSRRSRTCSASRRRSNRCCSRIRPTRCGSRTSSRRPRSYRYRRSLPWTR